MGPPSGRPLLVVQRLVPLGSLRLMRLSIQKAVGRTPIVAWLVARYWTSVAK